MSVRPISDFSEDELREYACEHVWYEIAQFVRDAQTMAAAKAGRFPMNFAIEVFALHVRNLLDFFAPRSPSPRKTDACAHHFCKDWEPPELDLSLREARKRADKEIAHLTTSRTADPAAKEWIVEPIAASLKPVIERFAEQAELVCDEFRSDVDSILSELPTA